MAGKTDPSLLELLGLMEIGFREGNRTMDQSIADLLSNRLITREEALNHCRERKTFAQPEQPKKPKSIWA